jgi:hypothetical protein
MRVATQAPSFVSSRSGPAQCQAHHLSLAGSYVVMRRHPSQLFVLNRGVASRTRRSSDVGGLHTLPEAT